MDLGSFSASAGGHTRGTACLRGCRHPESPRRAIMTHFPKDLPSTKVRLGIDSTHLTSPEWGDTNSGLHVSRMYVVERIQLSTLLSSRENQHILPPYFLLRW